LARHPWEITLREFVKIVRGNYGIEIELASATLVGSVLLKRRGGGEEIYPVLVLDPDEIMAPTLLQHICWFYGIPAEDFGLYPEDN
jgi:hypothetical protein